MSLIYMFLDKKTVLKIWLNLVLNFTIFRVTWPSVYILQSVYLLRRYQKPKVYLYKDITSLR